VGVAVVENADDMLWVTDDGRSMGWSRGYGQEMDRWRGTFLRRNGASRLVAILPDLSGLGV